MKVYIATSGDYSDYQIHGVYSTGELAKNHPYCTRVEEYELDEPYERHDIVRIVMLQNGDVRSTSKTVGLHDESGFQGYSFGKLIWSIHTSDENRAIKVVNEKRIQILAADCWGDEIRTLELFNLPVT